MNGYALYPSQKEESLLYEFCMIIHEGLQDNNTPSRRGYFTEDIKSLIKGKLTLTLINIYAM